MSSNNGILFKRDIPVNHGTRIEVWVVEPATVLLDTWAGNGTCNTSVHLTLEQAAQIRDALIAALAAAECEA